MVCESNPAVQIPPGYSMDTACLRRIFAISGPYLSWIYLVLFRYSLDRLKVLGTPVY